MNFQHQAMNACLTPHVIALEKSDNTEGYRPTTEDLAGLYRYRFETAGGLVMDCYLDHQTAEEATDVCPHIPEHLELIWACVGGIDISEVIGDCKQTIEEEALEELRA